VDDRRFDGLVRALASGASRRSILKGLLGLGGAAALAPLTRSDDVDAARRPAPTPTPVPCPGHQVWNGTACVCPSGVKCGLTCCDTAAQCCDNACCDAGSICTGEETCCPQSQMCNGACCGASQACCAVDGCCDGVCLGSGTCCTTGNVCSAANGDACCAPGQDCCWMTGNPACIDRSAGDCCTSEDCHGLTNTCNHGTCDPTTHRCFAQSVDDGTSCGKCATCQSGRCAECDTPHACCDDSACVDPTTGGCCTDADCAALSDACTSGVCDVATHQCIAQPLPDGTACGTCVTCTGGVCPAACVSPLLCCDGTTCVDPANGGCCADTDCPTSTDACFTYACQDNQCAKVDLITCPAGQDCVNGACACPGGKPPCSIGTSTTCCAAGETCQDLLGASGYSICCPDGTPACFDQMLKPVCCGGHATCQPASIDMGSSLSIEVCCEGTLCGLGCCSSDQVCAPLVVGNYTTGVCCAPGLAACYDGQSVVCCGAGETCVMDPSGYSGICCPTCWDKTGTLVCCGEAGFTCQPIMSPFGSLVDICCDGPPCFSSGGLTCCAVDQVCSPFGANPSFGLCCDAGSNACIYNPVGSSTSAFACCTQGQTCDATQGCVNPA